MYYVLKGLSLAWNTVNEVSGHLSVKDYAKVCWRGSCLHIPPPFPFQESFKLNIMLNNGGLHHDKNLFTIQIYEQNINRWWHSILPLLGGVHQVRELGVGPVEGVVLHDEGQGVPVVQFEGVGGGEGELPLYTPKHVLRCVPVTEG